MLFSQGGLKSIAVSYLTEGGLSSSNEINQDPIMIQKQSSGTKSSIGGQKQALLISTGLNKRSNTHSAGAAHFCLAQND